MHKFFIFIGVLFLLTCDLTAGVGRWTPRGPFGTSVVSMVADRSSGRIYAATDNGGVFVTTDAGSHWAAINRGLPDGLVTTLSIRTDEPSTLYATVEGGAIFKTSNGGDEWTFLANVPKQVTPIAIDQDRNTLYVAEYGIVHKSTDGGRSWVPTTQPSLNAIFFLAVSEGRVFLGTARGVYFSDDGGARWQSVPSIGNAQVFALTAEERTVVAATSSGVFATHDNGEMWSETGVPWGTPRDTTALLVDDRIYAGTSAGVFAYEDGAWAPVGFAPHKTHVRALAKQSDGALLAGTISGTFRVSGDLEEWIDISDGLPGIIARDVSVVPSQPTTAYAASSNGIFKTSDSGGSWKLVHAAVDGALHVEVAPSQEEIVYASSRRAIVKSTDSGETWTMIQPSFRTSSFAVAPTDAATVYAALSSGMARTTDGGASWSTIMLGLNNYYVWYDDFSTTATAVHPTNSAVALTSMWDGLHRTTSGGSLWHEVMPLNESADVVFDPSHPSILYAAAASPSFVKTPPLTGVYKSTDGGTTWHPAGLYGESVRSLAVSRADGSVYAGTARGEIYQSLDGGRQWKLFGDGLDGGSVNAISIDRTGKTLYAATQTGVFHYEHSHLDLTRLPDEARRLPDLLEQLLQSPGNAGLVLPIVGATTGANGNRFTTDVTLSHDRGADQDVQMFWLAATRSGPPPAFRMTLGSRTTLIDDIADRLGISGVGSLVAIAVNELGELDADTSIDGSARIWSRLAGQTPTSHSIPAVRAGALRSASLTAAGLRHDETHRTNVGVVNLDAEEREFSVLVEGERASASFTMSVPPWSLAQVSIPAGDYGDLRLTVFNATPGTAWTAYGSRVNRRSGEAVTEIGAAIPSASRSSR